MNSLTLIFTPSELTTHYNSNLDIDYHALKAMNMEENKASTYITNFTMVSGFYMVITGIACKSILA